MQKPVFLTIENFYIIAALLHPLPTPANFQQSATDCAVVSVRTPTAYTPICSCLTTSCMRCCVSHVLTAHLVVGVGRVGVLGGNIVVVGVHAGAVGLGRVGVVGVFDGLHRHVPSHCNIAVGGVIVRLDFEGGGDWNGVNAVDNIVDG